MLGNLSPIQNHILSRLKNATVLRYSDLQMTRVPNDLFNYHLQHLVKKELITRTKTGYSLSQKGIKHIADPYPMSDSITSLFKLNVITILSRRHAGKIEILSQFRTSNPSYGRMCVMGGVVRKSEPIEHAAARKLREETGLNARLKLLGCERRIMFRNGELFSDIVFPITYANSHSGELIPETSYGRNSWIPLSEAIKNESGSFDTIESVARLLKTLKRGTLRTLPFFFRETVQTDTSH